MRFLALGPLCVCCCDTENDREMKIVGAPKQRALLAVLLIDLNRVVSVDRLIAELWEEPPATALNVVRQYVSRLRKLLAPGRADGVELRTYSSGYALAGPHGISDAAQFEQLVQTARAQLREGHAGEARQSVDRALGLWRGDAFSDVPSVPCVAAERARLTELHTSAEELTAEAKLRSGDVAEAVSELTALTIRNPLRERTHATLMRALSADGRKADALRVYSMARETLQSELGVEPCSELRRVQHDILVGNLDRP